MTILVCDNCGKTNQMEGITVNTVNISGHATGTGGEVVTVARDYCNECVPKLKAALFSVLGARF